MKAQSELVGNRERRAETARPRFGGATTGMDDGNDEDSEEVNCDMELLNQLVLAAKTRDWSGSTTSRETPTGIIIETTYPEVSNRPAGQQWPVCTP